MHSKVHPESTKEDISPFTTQDDISLFTTQDVILCSEANFNIKDEPKNIIRRTIDGADERVIIQDKKNSKKFHIYNNRGLGTRGVETHIVTFETYKDYDDYKAKRLEHKKKIKDQNTEPKQSADEVKEQIKDENTEAKQSADEVKERIKPIIYYRALTPNWSKTGGKEYHHQVSPNGKVKYNYIKSGYRDNSVNYYKDHYDKFWNKFEYQDENNFVIFKPKNGPKKDLERFIKNNVDGGEAEFDKKYRIEKMNDGFLKVKIKNSSLNDFWNDMANVRTCIELKNLGNITDHQRFKIEGAKHYNGKEIVDITKEEEQSIFKNWNKDIFSELGEVNNVKDFFEFCRKNAQNYKDFEKKPRNMPFLRYIMKEFEENPKITNNEALLRVLHKGKATQADLIPLFEFNFRVKKGFNVEHKGKLLNIEQKEDGSCKVTFKGDNPKESLKELMEFYNTNKDSIENQEGDLFYLYATKEKGEKISQKNKGLTENNTHSRGLAKDIRKRVLDDINTESVKKTTEKQTISPSSNIGIKTNYSWIEIKRPSEDFKKASEAIFGDSFKDEKGLLKDENVKIYKMKEEKGLKADNLVLVANGEAFIKAIMELKTLNKDINIIEGNQSKKDVLNMIKDAIEKDNTVDENIKIVEKTLKQELSKPNNTEVYTLAINDVLNNICGVGLNR